MRQDVSEKEGVKTTFWTLVADEFKFTGIDKKIGREQINAVHSSFKEKTLQTAITKLYRTHLFFKDLPPHAQKNIVASDASLLKQGLVHPGIQEKAEQLVEKTRELTKVTKETARLKVENQILRKENKTLRTAVQNLSEHLMRKFNVSVNEIKEMARKGPEVSQPRAKQKDQSIML